MSTHKLGRPVYHVLALGRVPDSLGCPHHTRRSVFNRDQPLVGPRQEVGALPYKDAARAHPLRGIPGRLANVEVRADNVPLAPSLVAAALDNRWVTHAAGTLGRLEDGTALVEGLEGNGVVAVAEVKVDVRVGTEENDRQVAGKIRGRRGVSYSSCSWRAEQLRGDGGKIDALAGRNGTERCV